MRDGRQDAKTQCGSLFRVSIEFDFTGRWEGAEGAPSARCDLPASFESVSMLRIATHGRKAKMVLRWSSALPAPAASRAAWRREESATQHSERKARLPPFRSSDLPVNVPTPVPPQNLGDLASWRGSRNSQILTGGCSYVGA